MITSNTRCLLDTNVLIFGAIDTSPNFAKAKDFFTKVEREKIKIVLSSQNFLEFSSVMIRHLKKDPEKISADLNNFLLDPLVEIVYPTSAVLKRFINLLSSNSGVFPPDLFLAATAIENEVDYLVTDDRDFEKIKGIKVYNPFIVVN